MATTAQFNRLAELNHTHVIAVFLSEQRHRTHRLGFRYRRVTALLQMIILTDERVCQLLHLTQLFRRHFLEMREVKSQAVSGHVRTFLLYVLAQYFAQRIVNNVRSRVIAHDSLTACGVNDSR